MGDFLAKRLVHHFVQTYDAPPEKVFPLLSPVREADWVPGWHYRMIYSQSGDAELGCVFATPNPDGTETTWIVTAYDPANYRIEFVWVDPGLLATQIEIALSPAPPGKSRASVRYTYTPLSEPGNGVVDRYTRSWFERKMRGWERSLNHYLHTGQMTPSTGWE